MDSFAQDVRYAVRLLWKTPGFTLVALATLAVGIGANTALFSVVNAVLLEPLPYPEPERLYAVHSRHTSTDRYPFSVPEFCDYRDQNRTLEALAAFGSWNPSLTGDGPAERLAGLRVTGNLFPVLGARAAAGRTLLPRDEVPGQEKVVVLSHGLWQRRFGGDPAIVGRTLTLGGEPLTVVGVLEPGFLFPARGIELAVPYVADTDPNRHKRVSTSFLRLIGRGRPGVGEAQVADDLEGIARRLQAAFPDAYARKVGVLTLPYHRDLTRNFRPVLLVLLAAVGLLLLIACANLANLMLVRATARRKEMAVRLALGAKPWRLARQLLVESALLALAGAALGALLARWAVPGLVALSPAALPRAGEIRVSLAVLLFTLGTALVAGLLSGLSPALRAARLLPAADLKAESRGGAGDADRSRARGVIVSAQVALMVVLLTGAGLLLRSFRELMRVEPGFDQGVLTMRLALPRNDYPDVARMSRFYRELEGRVARLPGVAEVAAANQLPLNGAIASADYRPADRAPASESQIPTALYRAVTPAYFRTMGIPLLAGRAFTDDDREGSESVAVVSRSLARLSFPDRDPVGRELLVGDNPGGFRALTIVGVAGDVRHGSLEGEAEPHLYVPYHQLHPSLMVWLTANQFLIVRAAGGEPLTLADAVRREVQAVDPDVGSADVRTTGFYVEGAAAARRFSLTLLGGFSALALVLAAVGIYGVVSYSVAQRARETGVRIALGAGTRDILGLVLKEGVLRTTAGLVPGLAAALAASQAVRSQLFGVNATDPLTYVAVAAVLIAVTVAACLLPAWRAARVDPVRALASE